MISFLSKTRVIVCTIFLSLAIAGCVPPATLPHDSLEESSGEYVNVAESAGLAKTVAVEIYEMGQSEEISYTLAVSITDPVVIDSLVNSLAIPLTTQAPLRCIDKYGLRFHFDDAPTQEFGYYCDADNRLLRGAAISSEGFAVEPPQDFSELFLELIKQP